MRTKHLLRTAIIGLKTHKSRSLLTILGIVIGITSIIMVMSLGRGAQNLILSQIQSVGSKIIGISPGRHPTGLTDSLSTFTDSLKKRDLEALQNKGNVPHAEEIMPIVFGSESATYGNEIYVPTIFGGTGMMFRVYNTYPNQGRVFTEEDIQGYGEVAVIGSEVKEKLFGGDDALGQKIKIKGRTVRIIGVLPKTGQVSFLNFDKVIFMPYTTAQQYIFGFKHFNRIVIEADSEANVESTVSDAERTLRNNHNITDPEKDDFFVETQADAMDMVSTITNALTVFLAAIAAISLVVGGIGIMNIMLVSVTERTHEIGLRKALGATNKNILNQFLLEAVILTGVGGIIGIALGGGLSFLISTVLTKFYGLNWDFFLPLSSVLLGIGVSSSIGLIFGIYPARQAAKKDPIEALRYE
ncbi:MAG: ABC transporter permease [Candidatus Liptonbacteria bacterium]